jgi:hypothetical protein
LSEQSALTRTAEGELHIQAIVETEARKAALVQALSAVAGNPGVKVDVNTVAEAVREQVRLPAAPSMPRRVEISGDRIPAYPYLHEYFSRQAESDGSGPSTDEQIDQRIRRFANRAMNRSRAALMHALAIRRHTSEFARAGFGGLSSDQRARYDAILREHALGVARETSQLRAELEPVLFPGGRLGAVSADEATGDTDRVAARLVELALANEKTVRMALALSGDQQNLSIRGDQFKRNLALLETLAAQLAR